MTFNDLWGHTLFMKNLCLNNDSIHMNFYLYRFINECTRKKKAKIPDSHSHIFFVWDMQEITFLIINSCLNVQLLWYYINNS